MPRKAKSTKTTKKGKAAKGPRGKAKLDDKQSQDSLPGDQFPDVFGGPLTSRSFGLRVDDDVIVYVVGGDILKEVKGRVLEHKKGLHLVDEEGNYHRISYDWVTDIIVVRHNRPPPGDDPEYKRKAAAPPRKAPQPPAKPPVDQAYH